MAKRGRGGNITISAERLQHARDLIFGIAGGRSLDEVRINITEQDEFAQFETVLNAFAIEYRDSRAEGRRYEEECRRLIEAQRTEISVLSTPIIQVAEGVLAVLLVGKLDAKRAQEAGKRVLDTVHRSGESGIVVDVTGLAQIDEQAADALQQLVSALRLLGVQCVVTGIGSEVARAMVGSGIDLGVDTLATLKDGIRECTLRAGRNARASTGVRSSDGQRRSERSSSNRGHRV
ncbi:MAG TPA: STAS domain-containing protein [Labilithrix sp.]|jgi:rsbT co-antagonist protein RsbR|nr:STAS domain-containing protein [Labilithrix sp.]